MNRIFFILLSFFVMALAASCKQEDAEETQRKGMESALLSSGYQSVDGIYFKALRRTLCDTMTIAEQTNDDGTTTYDTTYHAACKNIEHGKIVTFEYSAKIYRGAVFATTYSADAAAAGIYPQPPPSMNIGNDALLEGVRRALLLMAEGDSASAVFPFTLGYGEEAYAGMVPPLSALEWIIAVKKVE
jgi:FKBP-type peptidyl-prolyl cis-trans isomerase